MSTSFMGTITPRFPKRDSMAEYLRVPDAEYKTALFQLRGQMRESLYDIFGKSYGQEIETQIATEIMIDLAEQFAMRVRGKKQIIKARRR